MFATMPETATRWAHETPNLKKLPEHVHHQKHASAVLDAFADELMKVARPLTALGREHVAKKNFALPGGRFPIQDQNHARNALARVAQHGTPEERAIVERKVHRNFPSIGKR